MGDIETLLRQEKERHVPKQLNASIRNNPAQKNCSYEDFIAMLRKVLTNVMPTCQFVAQEDIRDLMQPDIKIDHPIIGFEVISRSPRRAQKPMMRNEVIEEAYEDRESRIGMLYAWEMNYSLQFNIYASGYENVQKVMNTFEEAILSYTGYFKKNGVVELLFEKQIKDTTLEFFREHASIRSLQYYAILEKYWIDFSSVLESTMIKNEN